MKVLFLSAWYPNRYDAMAGLFVRKHAEAVSRYCDVQVLYVHADNNIRHFEIVDNNSNNIKEISVYYPSGNFIFKHFNFIRAYIKGFIRIRKQGFLPDILHANILTRTVFFAFCYKIITSTPYIISEHWSRYLPARNGYKGIFRKLITQLVAKNSSAILAVSLALKNAMIAQNVKHSNFHIINNVVDDFFYKEHDKSFNSKKRFLHISCFDEKAKNIKGIIRAIKDLSDLRDDFELVILGTGVDYDEIYQYYLNLKFSNEIILFLGEQTPEEVARWFSISDCFVLFSNYETAGVVIAESLACGKPVISTKVGIACEYINEDTGILVENGDEKALTGAMNYMLDHLSLYDKNKIKKTAQTFSFGYTGHQIFNLYKEILHINH